MILPKIAMFVDKDLLKVKVIMDRGKVNILNVDFLGLIRGWQEHLL